MQKFSRPHTSYHILFLFLVLVVVFVNAFFDELNQVYSTPIDENGVLYTISPEKKEEAVKKAEEVIGEGNIAEKPEVIIRTPKTQTEVATRMESCKANLAYANANFDDRSVDTDSDGLSDRTECYTGTNPLNSDTDGDNCLDGDELIQLNSDPKVIDCEIPKPTIRITPEGKEEVVLPKMILITDPQPGWILGNTTPKIAGIVPLDSLSATVVAIHADQRLINQLKKTLSQLITEKELENIENFLQELNSNIETTKEFVDLNIDFFNYHALAKTVDDLSELAVKLQTEIDEYKTQQETEEEPSEFIMKVDFEEALGQLENLKKEPIIIGNTDQFSETFFGEHEMRRFDFTSVIELEDQKLYDAVITARLKRGETVSSPAVRFGVNTGLAIKKPVPRSLGGALLSESLEVEIDEEQPTLSGDTEFSTQVFAIWNSIVLASSVIADSEKGIFEIQPPRPLDTDVSHQITLYAIKRGGDLAIRSDTVDVYFKITPITINYLAYGLVSGSALVLLMLSYLISRNFKKPGAPLAGAVEPERPVER